MANFDLPFGVRVAGNDPIDKDRYIAGTLVQRDAIVVNGRGHEGLQVYVEEDKSLYILKGATNADWTKVQAGSSLNKSGDWKYKNSIVTADPGSGNITFNNLDPALITEIYISQFTDGGGDASAYLNLMKTGTVVYIQVLNDSSKYITAMFAEEIVDEGGWYSVLVTIEDNGLIPSNNAIVHCDFFINTGSGSDPIPEIPTSDGILNVSTVPGPTVTAALDYLNGQVVGTYDEIKALRDAGALKPGNRYTLTNYQTKYFIDGSNSSGIKVENTVDSIFGTEWIIFTKGYDYLIEEGMVLTCTSLPPGYTGSHVVGDTFIVAEIFDNYYFRTNPTSWTNENAHGLPGAMFSYALDRYSTIPNDTVTNDGNGKPVMIPGGVVNADVHDGTDYMDQLAAENYPVPTEIITLIAASSDSFQPQGFSGTFLGDTIYYDMDDDEVLNDNLEVIATRTGKIFRRRNLTGKFDLEIDWRVQRYRRYLLDSTSRTKFLNQQWEQNGSNIGRVVIGGTYLITHLPSGAVKWTNVGAPSNTIGVIFTATTTAQEPPGGVWGGAQRVFPMGGLLIGEVYDIAEAGDTDFTLIGAADSNVGTRFTATGVGSGTGYVLRPTHTRDIETGRYKFSSIYRSIDDLDSFYVAKAPEESLHTLSRWAKVEEFDVILEANNRAKDFYTIPIDSNYEPTDDIERAVFLGIWKNVIIDSILGGIYNITSNIDGTGSLKDVYIQSGLRASIGSAMFWNDIRSLDWVDSPTGFDNHYLANTQFLAPTFFQGSTSGLGLREVIIGGSDRPRKADGTTYSWAVFANATGSFFRNCVIGGRMGEIATSQSKFLDCAFFLGGTESGSDFDVLLVERITFDSSVLENVVLSFLYGNEKNNFDRINTLKKNLDSPRDQYVWTFTDEVQETIFFLNPANNSLLVREYDASNVETIVEAKQVDSR